MGTFYDNTKLSRLETYKLLKLQKLTKRNKSEGHSSFGKSEPSHILQRQTPEEEHYQAREAVVSRIDSIVKQGLLQFDGLHVDHYGSFTSGLFSPTGDLDIAVEGILRLRTDRLNKG